MNQDYKLTAASGLHKGDREYQQDQVIVISHPRHPGCILAVVADGMGGLSGGRKAADQIVLTARQLFDPYYPNSDLGAALLSQLAHQAHTVIRLTAISAGEQPHSTLAAFLINPAGDCHWIHVGDSRIYHFNGQDMLHRTEDHSYVQELVSRGKITEQERKTHPDLNILTACLGTDSEPQIVSHSIAVLHAGDVLLACSDGLWHYFSDEELSAATSRFTAREAAEFLITQARTRAQGSGDNLSLVIVKLEPLAPSKMQQTD